MDWQPIDTAPRDGTMCLAWVPLGGENLEDYSFAVVGYCMDDGAFIPLEGDGDYEPTLWTPIIPPTEKARSE